MSRRCHIAILTIFLGGCATNSLPPNENEAPVANAGPDQEVAVGEGVALDASGSTDPDGDLLSFRWQLMGPAGSTAQLDNENNVTTGFVADVPGIYQVTLTATDGKLDSPPDTVRITAGGTGGNQPPLAVIDAPVSGEIGAAVTFDGSESSDPDGDSLFFDWLLEGAPDGSTATLEDPNSAIATLVPDVSGDYEVSLVVSDGTDDSRPVSLIFSATGPMNEAPVANAGRDVAVATGSTAMLDGRDSTDPERDSLDYIWSLVDKPSSSTATLSASDVAQPSLVTDVDGDYTVQLVVSDGELQSDPDTVTVTAVTGNVPPNAHAGPDQDVVVGETVTLDGSKSTDSEGDSLTYAWSFASLPNGSNTTMSDQFTASPTFVPDTDGAYVVQLVVNDGSADSAADTATITAEDPNRAPVASAGADRDARVGEVVMLNASSSVDPDGDSMTYSWELVFKPSSSSAEMLGENTATPRITPDMAGTYTMSVTVSDGQLEDTDMVTLSVLDASPSSQGDIVVTEFMADPDTLGDTAGEWFEIYNATSTRWNLLDCELKDLGSDAHTIGQSLVVPPMTYVTLARASSPGFGPDYVYGNQFVLGNSGDEIIIRCGQNEIARVEMLGASGFPSTLPTGASLGLLRNQIDETANDDGANWCESTSDYNGDKGTPGAPNEYQTACP